MENPDVLYFDGSCPLCQREMAHLAKMKSDQLVLQDIHALESRERAAPKEALLKSLHLRRGDKLGCGYRCQYRGLAIHADWHSVAMATLAAD